MDNWIKREIPQCGHSAAIKRRGIILKRKTRLLKKIIIPHSYKVYRSCLWKKRKETVLAKGEMMKSPHVEVCFLTKPCRYFTEAELFFFTTFLCVSWIQSLIIFSIHGHFGTFSLSRLRWFIFTILLSIQQVQKPSNTWFVFKICVNAVMKHWQ